MEFSCRARNREAASQTSSREKVAMSFKRPKYTWVSRIDINSRPEPQPVRISVKLLRRRAVRPMPAAVTAALIRNIRIIFTVSGMSLYTHTAKTMRPIKNRIEAATPRTLRPNQFSMRPGVPVWAGETAAASCAFGGV